MSSRHQARRKKGATRQTKGPGWSAERRAIWEEDNGGFEDWVLYGNSREVRNYWREKLGPQATYVYLIQPEGRPEIKIGYAVNPVTRLTELQCGNARELHIVGLMLGSKITERALHAFWKRGSVMSEGAHLLGEWFGNGYERAIREMFRTISTAQIKEHGEGFDHIYVRDMLPQQMLGDGARLEEEAA